MELAGRVAVVTGGGSGLGRATALTFARAGARVVVLDRDAGAASQTAATGDGDLTPACADVTDEQSVRDAFARIEETHGALHICVNAAGVATPGKTLSSRGPLPLEEFRRVVETNLIGLFDVLRHSARLMARNAADHGSERGVIVNVSSGAAWQGQRGQAAYAASKAGVLGLMLPVARDLAEHGIRVVTIAPGLFQTPLAARLPEQVLASLERMVLYPRRLGDPEEFAALAEHTVRNRYLNATTIPLDGGIRMT